MQLCETLDEYLEDDRKDLSSIGIYGTALAEYHTVTTGKFGSLYRSTLWSKIAPPGNLYRYLALHTEAREHSYDIWKQLSAIAQQHRSLLHLESGSKEASEKSLIEYLQRVEVHGGPKSDEDKLEGKKDLPITKGFKPLEVFLSSRPRAFGPLLLPVNPDQTRKWIQHRLMALLVMLTQVGVPIIIIVDEYERFKAKSINLKSEFYNRIVCLGDTVEDVCHTLAGVLLLTMFIFIIHAYVDEQRHHARKSGVLPQNRFWYITGNLINMWCGLSMLAAIPLVFFNEESARGIVMDSLTLLFVFMLDDLSGWAGTYLGIDDTDFQRGAAWHTAMLSQCPVRVSDLINPSPKSLDDLWQIRFNDAGNLQNSSINFMENPPPCKRRLRPAKSMTSERTRLSQAWTKDRSDEDDISTLRFNYSKGGGSGDVVLPRKESKILWYLWTATGMLLTVAQIGLPIFWMIMNKHCDSSNG